MVIQEPHVLSRSRWLARFGLAFSKHDSHDGFLLSVLEAQRDSSELFPRLARALELIRQYDLRCYRRLQKDCGRIWVRVLLGTIGEYSHPLRTISLDERFVAWDGTADSDIAATIVHEAMHARLCSTGVTFNDHNRARVERACFRREVAFAQQFPESQAFLARVKRLQELPDQDWRWENFQSHRLGAISRMLSYLGSPRPLTQLLVWIATILVWIATIIRRLRPGRAA